MNTTKLLALLCFAMSATTAWGQADPKESSAKQQKADRLAEECSTLHDTETMEVVHTADGGCQLILKGTATQPNFLDYLGVAVSVIVNTGHIDRIDEAKLVNGIVRIDKDSNAKARFMGEIHFALTCQNRALLIEGRKLCNPAERSSGLFLGLQPGSDKVIDSVAGGWMWRLPDKILNRALNVGLGVSLDENVKVLGDGIAANKPLPAGESEIRTRTVAKTGFVIIASLELGGRK